MQISERCPPQHALWHNLVHVIRGLCQHHVPPGDWRRGFGQHSRGRGRIRKGPVIRPSSVYREEAQEQEFGMQGTDD